MSKNSKSSVRSIKIKKNTSYTTDKKYSLRTRRPMNQKDVVQIFTVLQNEKKEPVQY